MKYRYLVKRAEDLPWGLRSNASAVEIDSTVPRVSTYCRAESHFDQPWFVASFTRRSEGAWSESGIYPMANGLGFDHGPSAAAMLSDHVVVDPNDPAALRSDGLRVRGRYECGACDFTLTAKSTSLAPILDTLWSYDIRELDLRSLAARLVSA